MSQFGIVRRIAGQVFHGWGLVVLALLTFTLAIIAAARQERAAASVQITVSGGVAEGQRLGALDKFARLARSHGLIVVPVESSGAAESLARVEAGTVDFALVPGGIDFSAYTNLRQVMSLQVLPLHVLVKEELALAVAEHLGSLRGKTLVLGGGAGTGSYWLAREVLAFAGLDLDPAGKTGDYVVARQPLARLAAETDRSRLPDAIFLIAPLPNVLVHQLVEQRGYRLVPLPFRDAFALTAITEQEHHAESRPGHHATLEHPLILKEHIVDAVIPAFTYQADPGVPPGPLHTLGMTALLVANRNVSADIVCRVIDVLFQTRYAKIVQPPLDLHRLEEIPEVPWHPGAIQYLERSKPVLTWASLGDLVNLVGIAGPILGGCLFLGQWIRQRTRFRREQTFEAYIAKVSTLERRVLELEEADSLDPSELNALGRELGRLKAEALSRFARGDLTGDALMTAFLTHVKDTRSLLAFLLRRQTERRDPADSAQEPDPAPR